MLLYLRRVQSGCMLAPFGSLVQRGEHEMGDVGKRDKGGREERKKSKLTQKERKKLKKEKQKNKTIMPSSIHIPS